jgi:hypothetical protein
MRREVRKQCQKTKKTTRPKHTDRTDLQRKARGPQKEKERGVAQSTSLASHAQNKISKFILRPKNLDEVGQFRARNNIYIS